MVVVGLDGGGTSCRVAAEGNDGTVVFAQTAGPVNASAADPEYCVRQLVAATEGCPDDPDVVAACFAGVSDERAATTIRTALRERFPHAIIRLSADHVAALLANPEADICVIAGTGSAVTSLVDGRIRVSGGHGPLIGDPGSAFRYGQAVLERVLTDPDAEPELQAAVWAAFGTTDRAAVITAVNGSPAPAALVARLAPALPERAGRAGGAGGAGGDYAERVIEHETGLLAETLKAHVRRYHAGREPQVSLAGGVWRSPAVIQAFERAVAPLSFDPSPVEPIRGALRLARMETAEAGRLTR